jgi:hypothetical protein
MKKVILPLSFLIILGLFGGCVKEDPNVDKGIFGHSAEYKGILENIRRIPNTIIAEVKSKTRVFSAKALAAGESSPKSVSLDIKQILIDEGISLDKLISIKLLDATVTIDPARCAAVTVRVTNFTLPGSQQPFAPAQSLACDVAGINASLAGFKNIDFAPTLKALTSGPGPSTLSAAYVLTATTDLPATANAATINTTIELRISTL